MPLEEARFEALGSRRHLLGHDLAPGRLSWAEAWVASLHERLSRFLPESELCRFNASAGAWVEVSGELEAMLRAALAAFQESGGRGRPRDPGFDAGDRVYATTCRGAHPGGRTG